MAYQELISVRVSRQMRAELDALAHARDTDLGKLLRAIIRRELLGAASTPAEQHEQILFIAIAMDGLLGVHPDPDLRESIITLWRERLAQEARRHVA